MGLEMVYVLMCDRHHFHAFSFVIQGHDQKCSHSFYINNVVQVPFFMSNMTKIWQKSNKTENLNFQMKKKIPFFVLFCRFVTLCKM